MSLCGLSVGEKFSVGGISALLGMGMTFLVLILLILSIALINFLIKKFFGPKKGSQKSGRAEVFPPEKGSETSTPLDGETCSAIEAAVRVYLRENGGDGKPHENIKIKSIKRV